MFRSRVAVLTVAQLVERQTVDDTLNSYLLVTGSIPVGEIFCFFCITPGTAVDVIKSGDQLKWD